MGYYSNVTIACDKETCQKIIDVCNNFDIDIDEISDTGIFNYIYIDFVEWYGGEDYVKIIDSILNGINKRLKNEPNAFAVLLRDGEDTYDMAILRYGNEEMSGRFYAKTMLDCTPLPSAQQWIPCSERLPEEDYVLISKKPSKISGDKWCVAIAIRMTDPRSGKVNWRDTGFGVIQDDKVLAWMPLPEPYKGEES